MPECRWWQAAVIARAGGKCEDWPRTDVRMLDDHVSGRAPYNLANGRALRLMPRLKTAREKRQGDGGYSAGD